MPAEVGGKEEAGRRDWPVKLTQIPRWLYLCSSLRAAGLSTCRRRAGIYNKEPHQATDHRTAHAWPLSRLLLPLTCHGLSSYLFQSNLQTRQAQSVSPTLLSLNLLRPRLAHALLPINTPVTSLVIASSPLHDPVKPQLTQSLGPSPDLSSAHLPMSGPQS